ncbi:Pycsar system effector family protein [Robertkochia aurantiaca]|uniref:Pycsar system effector family protein n=1 Tax=Robertkochia aurantiaca TaxID=2873700 RepID=UPI001CCCE1F5|nr:Pycsar system effector family protein [Robertkochia sp. 3YJGBD-33]
MNDKLVEEAAAYVSELLSTKLDKKYLYHNLRHTERVVKNTKVLIDNHELSPKEQENLLLAAWFHDTGYIHGSENHEENSCEIASDWLKEREVDVNRIAQVCEVILSTKMEAEPENELQKILKDADSSHLSKPSYINTSEILRQELKLTGVAEYSLEEWRKENIQLLVNRHKFYTDFAKKNWNKGKEENIEELAKQQRKAKRRQHKEELKVHLKGKNPDRGIQTLYRVTLRNHLKLSDIADTKANILLSVNAIIISLALANLIPKLDNPSNSHLLLPSLILVLFSVVSIIFAILSTRPNVSSGEFSDEDVKDRKVNLLFFGNFHKMPYMKYESALREMIVDQEYIYDSLTKDLYYLGVVLARKYRLLRITYTVFMIGIILSVLTFLAAFLLI